MKATNRSLSNAPFPGSVFHAHPSYSIHNMASSNTHKLLRHKAMKETVPTLKSKTQEPS